MHDPLVVAFEIRRPWPKRSRARYLDGTAAPAHRYWPSLATVWHREPGGHDAGDICKHYRRYQDADGTWQTEVLNRWRFHIHHWKIQVPALQELRRRLLTRCAWCRGLHSRRDPVNHSLSWDGPRGRWWQGESGLYHGDCASIHQAHSACLCEDPITQEPGYGPCARCGHYRTFGIAEEALIRLRSLAEIPVGARKES